MANMSLADQLDQSIMVLLADVDGDVMPVDAAADPEMKELLEMAALMRVVPDPQFKAALKDDLLLTTVALQGGVKNGHHNGHAVARPDQKPVSRQPIPAEILPTLLGKRQGSYPLHRSNFALSFLGHAVAVALLISSGLWMARRDAARNHSLEGVLTDVSVYLPKSGENVHGGGSGGDAGRTLASNGNIPRVAREQFTPPVVVTHNQDPKLAIEPTIVAPPIPLPQSGQTGNPLSAVLTPPSNGVGFAGGIGDGGSGGGIGSNGKGPGFGPGIGGGYGGSIYTVGGGVSEPRVLYRLEPEYSDEARKLRVQGTVTIAAVIDAQGRPQGLRVIQRLGVGLDEKAVEAVRKWRFQPAMKDSRPVAVLVNIEVSFRLY